MVHITLVASAVVAGLLVYRYDLYDREPWYMLVGAALAGMGLMWIAGHLEDFTLGIIEPTYFSISVVAATHEELLRFAFVAALAIVLPSKFNDPMDGIIYGSVTGLGMAITEAFGNVAVLESLPHLPPLSELVRFLGHMVMGGIMCFGVGLARHRVERWRQLMVAGVIMAVVWHFAWDWLAFSAGSGDGDVTEYERVKVVALIIGGMLVYGAMVVYASQHSRRLLAPGSETSVWGWPLVKRK